MAPVTGSLILLILCCAGALADNHDIPPPPSEKPGGCPPTILPACEPPSPNNCNSDKECQGNLKCCWQGCNKNCTAPIIEKPGTCPPPWFVCSPDDESPDVSRLCEVDSDCPGNKKCCIRTCYPECIRV
ncbi:WAP four-disulfide core domain protein 5-like [Bufo gargarizans]|uniref:WAP four-disulfide core domain protein 5-like n=1 Tax=Bufo gargarizans TaxID=30331 RepID=UPI001CF1FD6D|nr:WAP four-disulfide core domain protein 5-like [Bufo gargarizans]